MGTQEPEKGRSNRRGVQEYRTPEQQEQKQN